MMSSYPLFKFLFFFVLGILYGFLFNEFNNDYLFSFILLIAFSFFIERFFKNYLKWKKIIIEIVLIVTIFLSGNAIYIVKKDLNKRDYVSNIILINQNKKYQSLIKLVSPIVETKSSVKFEGELIGISYPDSTVSVSGKVIVHLSIDSASLKLIPGDNILIKSNIKKIENPLNSWGFNYASFLESKQIEYILYANNNWKYIKYEITLKRIATICRNYCIQTFKKAGLIGEEFAVASALTFGYKDELDNEIRNTFSSSGAMHILAVSGLHVGIIYLMMMSLFKLIRFPLKYSWIKFLITIFIIWSYALISGLSPSVIRATTMLSFFIVAELFNKSTNVYNILAISAVFLLIIDPFYLMQVSFQLSYFAVLGILYLQPKIKRMFFFRNWLVNKIWMISSVSIAAQIATFPLALFYFHRFPNYFLLTNLFVIPVAFVLLVLGILIIVFSFSSKLLMFLGKGSSYVLKALLWVLKYIEEMPWSLSDGFFISKLETFLIYLAILSLIIYVRNKNKLLLGSFLTVFAIIFFLDFKEDIGYYNQKIIMVYKLDNHFALDLISGNNHYFIAEQSVLKQSEKTLFNIKNNWSRLDLNDPVYLDINSFKSKTIKWENKAIGFINNNWNDTNSLDIALFFDDCILKNKKINWASINQIVVNRNNYGLSFFGNEKINKSSIHNISKMGAYIHEL